MERLRWNGRTQSCEFLFSWVVTGGERAGRSGLHIGLGDQAGFKHEYVFEAASQVLVDRVRQGREQVGAQKRLVIGHGVGQAHHCATWVVCFEEQCVATCLCCERVGENFGESHVS